MSLIKCPECGKEIENIVENSPECGCPIAVQSTGKDRRPTFAINSRLIRNVLIILSVICFIASGVFFGKGYSVKNEYYDSEDYYSLNKNAYVGGDAYNYIINGTYFTGYSVIASALLLSGIILISNSITIKIKEYEWEKEIWH